MSKKKKVVRKKKTSENQCPWCHSKYPRDWSRWNHRWEHHDDNQFVTKCAAPDARTPPR